MSIEFWKPEEIEAESFRRISEELGDRQFPAGVDLVVKRVIHTTADFFVCGHPAFFGRRGRTGQGSDTAGGLHRDGYQYGACRHQ